MTPWTAVRQASLSFTISQSLLKLMSIESVMPCNHLILCYPLLLLPPIFSSIGVFSNELALPSGGQSVLKITLLLSSLRSELYHSSWTLTSDLSSFRGEDLETQREGQPINLWQHHGWAPEVSQSPRPARLPRNWELPKDASKFIPGWGPWKPLFLSLDSHFISLLIKISNCRSSPLN